MGILGSVGAALMNPTTALSAATIGSDIFMGFKEHEWAKDASKENREWQERMSNTAYQRAMRDMKAAGLNPMLAAHLGGASSPTGSQTAPTQLSRPSQSAMQTAQAAAAARQPANIDSQTELNRSQARLNDATTDNMEEKTRWLPDLSQAEIAERSAAAGLSQAQTTKVTEDINRIRAQVSNLNSDTALKQISVQIASVDLAEKKILLPFVGELVAARLKHEGSQADLSALKIPEAKAMADKWNSDVSGLLSIAKDAGVVGQVATFIAPAIRGVLKGLVPEAAIAFKFALDRRIKEIVSFDMHPTSYDDVRRLRAEREQRMRDDANRKIKESMK